MAASITPKTTLHDTPTEAVSATSELCSSNKYRISKNINVRIDQEMQCTMLDYYTPQDLEIKIKLETEG